MLFSGFTNPGIFAEWPHGAKKKLFFPVGEHLKYVIFLNQRPIAYFAFSSAPRHNPNHAQSVG